MTTTTNPTPRPILTHCAICRLALTDSQSVEVGIGPDCRKRVGYDKIPNALRERANELIAQVSLNLTDAVAVRFAADELRTMGLDRLAACLLDRFAVIFLAEYPECVACLTPYGRFGETVKANLLARWSFNAGRASRYSRFGSTVSATPARRYFRRGTGAWTMPKTAEHLNRFWQALVAQFPGMLVKVSGQSIPLFLEGATMPSLAPDSEEAEKSTNDNAREIRAFLTSLDFGGRAVKFDAFGFSVAAAQAGYSLEMFATNPVRAFREHSLDAARVFDVDAKLAAPKAAPAVAGAPVSADVTERRKAAAAKAVATRRARLAAAVTA